MSNRLYELIGTTYIDHVAYPVHPTLLKEAVNFFVYELGWLEDTSATVSGKWGCARFVYSPLDPSIKAQLTADNEWEGGQVPFPGVHLAIKIANAENAAEATVEWAHSAGYEDATCNRANPGQNNKWFVSIPGLFTFTIEYIDVV